MVSVLTILNGFPAARVNRTIRTLLTQFPRNYSLATWNLRALIITSVELHLSLHLTPFEMWGVCVPSNKYVAACAELTELLSHEQTRPARRYLPLPSPAPCSDQFHLSPASLLPASPGPSHRHCSTLACPCQAHGADQVTTKTISSWMRKVL